MKIKDGLRILWYMACVNAVYTDMFYLIVII